MTSATVKKILVCATDRAAGGVSSVQLDMEVVIESVQADTEDILSR